MTTNTKTATLYTKPGCHRCRMSLRYLKGAGIEVNVRDIVQDPAAFERITTGLTKEDGTPAEYKSLPVIETSDGQHWNGHDEDKLAAFVAA